MGWKKGLMAGLGLGIVAVVVQIGGAMLSIALIGQSAWNFIPFGANGVFVAVVALANVVKEEYLSAYF